MDLAVLGLQVQSGLFPEWIWAFSWLPDPLREFPMSGSGSPVSVQIQSGKHAGRLVVPSIATYTNASAASCPVASACWTSATHDHALYSDDGGSSWLSGTPSGGIAGCGKKDGAQCGDEFQVVELSGGGVLGVSRHNGMLAFSSFTKDLRVSRKVAVFVVFNLTCMNTNEFWQAGPRSP